jgi:hypothetical protein
MYDKRPQADSTSIADSSHCAADMSKSKKFVDPIDVLYEYTPPPHKTKLEAFRDFFYNSEEGSYLGRTPQQWGKYMKELYCKVNVCTVYSYQRFGITCYLHLQGRIIIGAWRTVVRTCTSYILVGYLTTLSVSIIYSVDDRMSSWWNENWQGISKYKEKVTKVSVINPT